MLILKSWCLSCFLFLGGDGGLKYNNITIENMAFWSIVLGCIYTYHILYVYSVWLSITHPNTNIIKLPQCPSASFLLHTSNSLNREICKHADESLFLHLLPRWELIARQSRECWGKKARQVNLSAHWQLKTRFTKNFNWKTLLTGLKTSLVQGTLFSF